MLSENKLIELLNFDYKEFVKILTNNNTDINTLNLGLELLVTDIKDDDSFLEIIKVHLKHKNASVREGACMALSSFSEHKKIPGNIIDCLSLIANNDPSSFTKEQASFILNNLNKN